MNGAGAVGAGAVPDGQDCCLSWVTELFPDALMVHRIDMDTSGLSFAFKIGTDGQVYPETVLDM